MWGLTQQLDELRKENEELKEANKYLSEDIKMVLRHWKAASKRHEDIRNRRIALWRENKRLRTAIEKAVGALELERDGVGYEIAEEVLGILTAELTEKIP